MYYETEICIIEEKRDKLVVIDTERLSSIFGLSRSEKVTEWSVRIMRVQRRKRSLFLSVGDEK